MPHGHCYLWKPGLVWLQVISNGLIGLSYVSISLTLAYLVLRIRNIPFQWMYIAFGLFIITCGFTHFMDIWTIWSPIYWSDGLLRAITAIASVGTAIMLPPLVPKAISLAQGAKLAHDRGIKIETAYQELGRVFEKTKELDELKIQFFANVSHELRTPLALILGPAEKIRAASNLTDEQRRNLEIVSRNASVLLKHVNDLLDVAKLEAGKMEPQYADCDVARLVRLTSGNFDGLAAERNIVFTVEAPSKLGVQIDPNMMQRILLNLLSNAFKFVPVDGQIKVTLQKKNSHFTLSVWNSGPGISVDKREIIFERFRQIEGGATRGIGGTGLGLSIVKEFVELHRGVVKVSDSPVGGTVFTVELPMQAPAGVHVLPQESVGSSEANQQAVAALKEVTKQVETVISKEAVRGTVLVIEDNPDMNRFVVETLSPHYRVLTAFNGKEGLEKTAKEKPDLVLSDVMMPIMSGDQMIVEMRKNPELENIPVILLTAKADDDLRIRMLRGGVQDYVIKPFSSDEVLARVQNLVTMKRAREVLQSELTSQIRDLEALAREVSLRRKELQRTTDELRMAKEQAERASQVKTNFLGMVTHEVRTPMTSLKLQLQMLKRGGHLNPKQVELVDRIETSAGRSLTLTESILNFARIQSGKIVPSPTMVDLPRLVQDVVDFFQPQASEKKLHLRLLPTVERLPELRSDPMLIDVVVRNLISNAIKYTEAGSILISITHDGVSHHVSVEDTGAGIAPEHQSTIFEPFEQLTLLKTKHKPGFGLGLSIAKSSIEALGGKIELKSEVGKGSIFTAVFPQLQETQSSMKFSEQNKKIG